MIFVLAVQYQLKVIKIQKTKYFVVNML